MAFEQTVLNMEIREKKNPYTLYCTKSQDVSQWVPPTSKTNGLKLSYNIDYTPLFLYNQHFFNSRVKLLKRLIKILLNWVSNGMVYRSKLTFNNLGFFVYFLEQ